MAAIAIVVALITLRVRLSHVADQYRATARYHGSQSFALLRGRHWSGSLDGRRNISINSWPASGGELKGRDLAIVLWHLELSDKYQTAALLPWIPLPPDPPAPN